MSWDGARRCDGLTVAQGTDGWIVLPTGDGGEVIDRCPCCTLPIGTAYAAKLIADNFFPVQS